MKIKKQYKIALKEDMRIIRELKETIVAREKQISNLQSNCKFWQDCYVEAHSVKKWWQFWK